MTTLVSALPAGPTTTTRAPVSRAPRPTSTARPAPSGQAEAEPGEAELLAAREGDTAALGRLYDRYSPALYAYLYRRTGDPELARDLTSAAFLKVIEAIQARRAWRQSFTGWLYRLAHNLLVDHHRSLARRPQLPLDESVASPAGATMETSMEQASQLDEVRSALGELRPEYAQILLLRFSDGLSHADVGRIMGKSEDNVKVTQCRALKALRKQMRRQRGERPPGAGRPQRSPAPACRV